MVSGRSRILQGRGIKWTSGLKLPFHGQIAQPSFPIPFVSGKRDLHEWLLSLNLWSVRSHDVHSCSRHWGLGDWEIYYPLAVAGGKRYVAKCCSQEVEKKKKTTFAFIFRCPNKSSPPSSHCNKNITIIKHLCQPKSIPKSLAPVGRPAANKALNLRETFLQLLIKYNTAKFHL